MLSVTKTDEIDARLIAMYGEKMQPTSYKLRNDTILILKQNGRSYANSRNSSQQLGT